jgi:hypothetical protein
MLKSTFGHAGAVGVQGRWTGPLRPTAGSRWRRPTMIPMPRCGPGCAYATKHPCHGFRRAWAALCYVERCDVNKNQIHWLWHEEGLQV